MPRTYIYVVDRDFGFAPNPFHGYCTLATCKPRIRTRAQVGDWVMGMGGRRIGATGRLIYAMRITGAVSFDQYWSHLDFRDKRPVRNGSAKTMVGDNIYHQDPTTQEWRQADSHHSNSDGSANPHNTANDTQANRVLISTHFIYLGRNAVTVPAALLGAMGYSNGRGYRVFDGADTEPLINWLEREYQGRFNLVLGDPFDFAHNSMRYSSHDNRLR